MPWPPPAVAPGGPPACGFTPDPNPPGPGFAPCEPTKAHYSEKMAVGYRWYAQHGVAPAFDFGHGLSYATCAPAADQT